MLSTLAVVQSLNSPFFLPHIGAEPGRAKREFRITCMLMLRTPPFIRGTQGFDILMLMLMLMSPLSSLAHKLVMLMLASLVRTGL